MSSGTSTVPIFVRTASFRLPPKSTTPVIMVGSVTSSCCFGLSLCWVCDISCFFCRHGWSVTSPFILFLFFGRRDVSLIAPQESSVQSARRCGPYQPARLGRTSLVNPCVFGAPPFQPARASIFNLRVVGCGQSFPFSAAGQSF
jgi:hypothetical protein